MEAYCVKYKAKTEIKNPQEKTVGLQLPESAQFVEQKFSESNQINNQKRVQGDIILKTAYFAEMSNNV